MRKAIYLRKRFWQFSSVYERRVNNLINWIEIDSNKEITGIITEINSVIIFYIEKETEDTSNKVVKGFSK